MRRKSLCPCSPPRTVKGKVCTHVPLRELRDLPFSPFVGTGKLTLSVSLGRMYIDNHARASHGLWRVSPPPVDPRLRDASRLSGGPGGRPLVK
jgi:hypothetical protein